MESKIKIANVELANMTEAKEEELYEALRLRIEERAKSGGEFVIVRAKEAGVFFGVPTHIGSGMVVLDKCRRLWYWSGAASCSQLASDGTEKTDCKFSVRTNGHVVWGAIEMIPCTSKAAKHINAAKEWTA
jgi:hypothetical protein